MYYFLNLEFKMKKIFEFEIQGSFWNFHKVSEIPGTYLGLSKLPIKYRDLIAKIVFQKKGLGTFLTQCTCTLGH